MVALLGDARAKMWRRQEYVLPLSYGSIPGYEPRFGLIKRNRDISQLQGDSFLVVRCNAPPVTVVERNCTEELFHPAGN